MTDPREIALAVGACPRRLPGSGPLAWCLDGMGAVTHADCVACQCWMHTVPGAAEPVRPGAAERALGRARYDSQCCPRREPFACGFDGYCQLGLGVPCVDHRDGATPRSHVNLDDCAACELRPKT